MYPYCWLTKHHDKGIFLLRKERMTIKGNGHMRLRLLSEFALAAG